MPGYVYILKSLKNGIYYVGSTKNLEQRIRQHNSGSTQYSKNNRPYTLSYFQKYQTIAEARKIETWLKKSKSRILIEKIITDGKILKLIS